MIYPDLVSMETSALAYLGGLCPKKIIKVLEENDPDCQNLMKVAKSEGKDTSQMHLTIHAQYALYGLEKDAGKITAVFICNPICWTYNLSDWWWESQRHNESFKDLLRKATNTRGLVRVEAHELKLLPIPRWFSEKYRWKLIKK